MNLREYFSKYPLGCDSFGVEWLRRWNGSAVLRVLPEGVVWRVYAKGTCVEMVTLAEEVCCKKRTSGELRFRAGHVVMEEGTIVYVWGSL